MRLLLLLGLLSSATVAYAEGSARPVSILLAVRRACLAAPPYRGEAAAPRHRQLLFLRGNGKSAGAQLQTTLAQMLVVLCAPQGCLNQESQKLTCRSPERHREWHVRGGRCRECGNCQGKRVETVWRRFKWCQLLGCLLGMQHVRIQVVQIVDRHKRRRRMVARKCLSYVAGRHWLDPDQCCAAVGATRPHNGVRFHTGATKRQAQERAIQDCKARGSQECTFIHSDCTKAFFQEG